MFNPQARQKGIALKSHLDDNIPTLVKGDTARIKQVLVNLIGNAIKFTNRGNVTLKVSIHSKETREKCNVYTLLC